MFSSTMEFDEDFPQQQLRRLQTEITQKRAYLDYAKKLLSSLHPTDERRTKILASTERCERDTKDLESKETQLKDEIEKLTLTRTTDSTSLHAPRTGDTLEVAGRVSSKTEIDDASCSTTCSDENLPQQQQQVRRLQTEITQKQAYLDCARKLMSALHPTDERRTKIHLQTVRTMIDQTRDYQDCARQVMCSLPPSDKRRCEIMESMQRSEKMAEELEIKADQLQNKIAQLTITDTTEPVTPQEINNVAACDQVGVLNCNNTKLDDEDAPVIPTLSKSQKRKARKLRSIMRHTQNADHEHVTYQTPTLQIDFTSQMAGVGMAPVGTTEVGEEPFEVSRKNHRFSVESAKNAKRFVPRSTNSHPSTTVAGEVLVGNLVFKKKEEDNPAISEVHRFSVESAEKAIRFVPKSAHQLQTASTEAKSEFIETLTPRTADEIRTNFSGENRSIDRPAVNVQASSVEPSAHVVQIKAQASLDSKIARCNEYLLQIEDRIAQCKPEDDMMTTYIEQREEIKLNLTTLRSDRSNFPRDLNQSSSSASSSVQLEPLYVLNEPLKRTTFRERLVVQERERLDPTSDQLKRVVEECEATNQEAFLERVGTEAEQRRNEEKSESSSTSNQSNVDDSARQDSAPNENSS